MSGGGPAVGCRIVAAAGVQIDGSRCSVRPRRSSRSRSRPPCGSCGPAGRRSSSVAVQASRDRVVAPAVVSSESSSAAPDDHLGAGPDRGVVRNAPTGRTGRGRWRPAVGGRIVPPAGVDSSSSVSCRPRRSSRCRSRPPCGTPSPSAAVRTPSRSNCHPRSRRR